MESLPPSTINGLHMNPLHEAASLNDTGKIEKLLNGRNWSLTKLLLDGLKNESGQTSLHVAVKNNSFDAVVMLIKKGCDINAQDDMGNTPLHIAGQGNFIQIWQHIMNLPFNRDVKNKTGDTPLHLAVVNWGKYNRDIDKHDAFIAFRKLSPTIPNFDGYSPFHLAIKLDKRGVVEVMLEVQPELAQLVTENGEPPLWVALKYGHYDMMEFLLKMGCNVNQKNTKIGAPTIWLAIYKQDNEAIRILQKSPEFEQTTLSDVSHDGISPMMLAMFNENQRFKISSNGNEWSIFALKITYALATKEDFEKIEGDVEMFDRTDDQGNTLLHLAVLSDSLEMVEGVIRAGGKNFENVINLARMRQCPDILKTLYNARDDAYCPPEISFKSPTAYYVTREFPRFSDDTKDLFDKLKDANKPWFNIEPNLKDQIDYQAIKKCVIPKVNIKWTSVSDIKKDNNVIPSLTHMELHVREHSDDENTTMIRDFLSILVHMETYLQEEDEVFKHLDIVLLPVGSTVEGTKVGRLNELDVMFFCKKLNDFLAVVDERSIVISQNKFENFDIIKDLFNITGTLDIAKFFAKFMQSIGNAMQHIVDNNKVPKKVKLFMGSSQCTEPDCEVNKGFEWSQCRHMEPPCVCYTAVGAGLNFVWKGKENMNMLFTIDIVPNFYVNLKRLSNFSLRQKLIMYLIGQKPVGWANFLKKYILHDRIYLGQYDMEEKHVSCVSLKMVNSRGDFVIRPGLNMEVENMLEDEIVYETYCFLKVLKAVTASKANSFDLKKTISDQLKSLGVERPSDVRSFASLILNSPEHTGKFDGLSQSLAKKKYLKVDLLDFPTKSTSNLALQLISKDASDLVINIQTGNWKEFQRLLKKMPAAKDMTVNGKSFLHFAALNLEMNMISDLLLTECDVKMQDLKGNTALHYVLCSGFEMSKKREDDVLGIMKLLLLHHDDNLLGLQNKNGHTVFHLLTQIPLGSKVDEYLFSKATKQMLDLRDQQGFTAMMLASSDRNDLLAALIEKGGEAAMVRLNHNDLILAMIEKGASVHVKDNSGKTALYIASEFNNCFLIEHLFTKGANINERDKKGSTPLMAACSATDCRDAVNLLMKRGAEVNAINIEGCTSLYTAIMNGNLDTARLLVESGKADLDKAGALGTPLFIASRSGQIEAVEYLLKKGASVRTEDETLNPLLAASQKNHVEVVRQLLKYGADPDSAIALAVANGHTEVVELLLKCGANVNKTNLEIKANPLALAAMMGCTDVVKVLLNHNADVNIRVATTDGGDYGTPLHLACLKGHLSIVKILVEKGGAVIDNICILLARDHGEIDEYLLSQML